ncbi:unnamed protein product [Vitrella brassicaformis CCMP3155]|uniref:Uncharacterized protein n=1 Tax=Vitrella brassicaformis (strain CCMP3155) TaxID=1169540 RepID=A0A0G4EC54_VITBC|nr:unnamed protein product [Vitrella brassicaformis CCMP3155]|eukprot:CEL93063.1 unnamed protein product [Vitrella brassicaformis CCMP3155]
MQEEESELEELQSIVAGQRQKIEKLEKEAKRPVTVATEAFSAKKVKTPHEMVSFLDQYVIGQLDAKEALVTMIRNRWCFEQEEDPDDLTEESSIDVLTKRPTGSGKTELCRCIANIVQAPFIIADATQYTRAGYVGRSVSEIIDDVTRDTATKTMKAVPKQDMPIIIEALGNADRPRPLAAPPRSKKPPDVIDEIDKICKPRVNSRGSPSLQHLSWVTLALHPSGPTSAREELGSMGVCMSPHSIGGLNGHSLLTGGPVNNTPNFNLGMPASSAAAAAAGGGGGGSGGGASSAAAAAADAALSGSA